MESADECKGCQKGQWSSAVGVKKESACINCGTGKFGIDSIGANANTTCTKCGKGKYLGTVGAFGSTSCVVCPLGFVQNITGQAFCLPCTPGSFSSQEGRAECLKCAVGRSSTTVARSLACDACTKGRYQATQGMTACLNCIPGKYQVQTEQSECIKCQIGKASLVEARKIECDVCTKGNYQPREGAVSCTSCDLGTFGNTTGTTRGCTACPINTYQDERKQLSCKKCSDGKIPNPQQTSCEVPEWKRPQDCSPSVEYLNDTDTDEMAWSCEACPEGAFCGYHGTFADILALAGHWRVPWSEHNITFLKCPYLLDCIGIDIKNSNEDNDNAKTNQTVREGCAFGTTGPLCSLCIDGYNRDINTCTACVDETVPVRIAVLVVVVLLLCLIIVQCRKRIRKKWKKYKSLWRDMLSVVAINITFLQINSSLTSVIDVAWPEEWSRFVRHFNFVNIDVLALVGASCIGGFNYYLSFTIMVCFPVGILVMAVLSYYASVGILSHKLATMTEVQKKEKRKEAMHALFELTDADHSGYVDPLELANILRALGWTVKLKEAMALLEKIGVSADEFGHLILGKEHFVRAMASGQMTHALEEMNARKSVSLRRRFSGAISSQPQTTAQEEQAHVKNSDKLVKWTLRSALVANSLSGATQLLLLAHTPVSRKVFQYFHCHDIAGRQLLRADYAIDCTSNAYFSYMTFVICVLLLFTIALPVVISFYLFVHRKNLYTTRTHQKIGWLYAPFVRGAEFWQVHDLLIKMILTGMLIYVPSTSRAGIAVLICIVAIANLNYFEPHKNKVLFWLSQVSFVTTASKYIVALLLSASMKKRNVIWVGGLMIGLDIFFMTSSAVAIVISLWMLHSKVVAIHHKDTKVEQSPSRPRVKITPLSKLSHRALTKAVHHATAVKTEKVAQQAHDLAMQKIEIKREQVDKRLTNEFFKGNSFEE